MHQEVADAQPVPIEAERKAYLSLEKQEVSGNPLNWWKVHAMQFPRLAILARQLLAIPASSAPAECVVSKLSCICAKNQCGMKPELANTLAFIAHNSHV
jgi:hypothetical protein